MRRSEAPLSREQLCQGNKIRKRLSEYLAVAKALPKENDFCNKRRIRHHHGDWAEHGLEVLWKLCAAGIAWRRSRLFRALFPRPPLVSQISHLPNLYRGPNFLPSPSSKMASFLIPAHTPSLLSPFFIRALGTFHMALFPTETTELLSSPWGPHKPSEPAGSGHYDPMLSDGRSLLDPTPKAVPNGQPKKMKTPNIRETSIFQEG